ncbi:MAG: hypothetical protein H0X41_10465, partial [Chitinophagaceae bacterium]|nr:hypothetical protein [Chitinophagaceae bacterium]
MKKLLMLGCCCFLLIGAFGQSGDKDIAIIPVPVSITTSAEMFVFPKQINIEAPANDNVGAVAEMLKDRLQKTAGLEVSAGGAQAMIRLILNQPSDATIGQEGYHLTV